MKKSLYLLAGIAFILGGISLAGIFIYSGFLNEKIIQEISTKSSCSALRNALVFNERVCPENGETKFFVENSKKILGFKIVVKTSEGDKIYQINGANSFPDIRSSDSQFGDPVSLPISGGEYVYNGLAESISIEGLESQGLECSPFEVIDFSDCGIFLSPSEEESNNVSSNSSGSSGGGSGGGSGRSGGSEGGVSGEEDTLTFGIIYGSAVAMDSLANTHAGSPDGAFIIPAIGFTAEHTGNFESFYFHHAGGTGYANGTGGEWRAEIYASDPATNTPTGSSLSNKTMSPSNATSIEEVDLDTPVPVTEGKMYHILFRNIDSAPNVNYFSVDSIYVKNPDNETFIFPRYNPDKLIHQYFYNGSWIRRTNFLPILEINYDDGFHQGMSYNEIQYGDGVPGEVGGSQNVVREVINFSEGDRAVSGVGIRVLKISGTSSPLVATIKNSTGGEIASASISASSVFTGPAPAPSGWDAVGQYAKWAQANFSSPVALLDGHTYYLEFSSTSGTYWMWSIRHYVNVPGFYQGYPFDEETAFTDGYAQKTVNGGTNWTYLGKPSNQGKINNLQLYLTISDQEVECQGGSQASYCQTILTGGVISINRINPRDPETNLVILVLIAITIIAIIEIERRRFKK